MIYFSDKRDVYRIIRLYTYMVVIKRVQIKLNKINNEK